MSKRRGFPSSPYSTVTWAFPSGLKPWISPYLRAQGEGYGQAVGQDNRQRKHFRCFVTRIADHHALIPGSKLRYGIFLSAISSLLQRAVYTGRDIRALLVNQALDGKIGTDRIPLRITPALQSWGSPAHTSW